MKRIVKKNYEVLLRVFIAIAILFTNFAVVLPVKADEYNKGDVVNPVITSGALNNPGDVQVTKEVTKTNTDGVYQISINVKGKDKTTTIPTEKDVYAVVVFDRSESMSNYCDGIGGMTICIGDKIYKWDNAVNGAKTFAKTLLGKITNAKIALVTFSSNAKVSRNFSNNNLDSADFENSFGLTNIESALKQANNLLKSKSIPNDAYKYIVFIGDGYPEVFGETSTTSIKKAKDKADEIKNNSNIQIFSIGYDVDNTGKDILQYISKDSKGNYHYVDSDPTAVASAFTNIANEISTVPAGRNAVLNDILGDEFTYVEGSKSSNAITVNNKDVSINIGNITEDGSTYTFNVKINPDIQNELYRTNKSYNLSYTDADNNTKSLNTTDSSKIYWETQKYDYTINYYKDEIKVENKLGTSITNVAAKNTIITADITLNMPIGYEFSGKAPSIKISNVNENIINVIYTKKTDLTYTIDYYKDNTLGDAFKSNTVTNQTFGKQIIITDNTKNLYKPLGYQDGKITEKPDTIAIGRNTVKICYEKDLTNTKNVSYTIEYYKDNVKVETDTDTETVWIGNNTLKVDKVDTKNNKYVGYKFSNTNPEVLPSTIENGSTIKVYYVKDETKTKDISYTIEYYKDNVKVETDTDTETVWIGNNTLKVDKVDTRNNKYVGYKFSNTNPEVLPLTIENGSTIKVYYEIKKDLKYRVEYYLDEVIDSSKTDYFTNITYGTVINGYIEKMPKGYLFVKDNAPLTIEENDDNNVIKVYYAKINEGEIVPPKTGIDNSNYLPIIFSMSLIGLFIFIKKEQN